MAKHKYDVCVARKGKDEKTYWTKIGVVLQGDKGFSLKLESVPVAWDGWASLFEPKAKEGQAPASRPADSGKAREPGSDEVPW